MTPRPARALAWLTFAVGIAVSVLGNIGHAASDGMQSGEWAGAAFWPVSLLLSVEIIVRIRWQPEKRWVVARITGLVVVSVVAAILSYLHLRSLLIFWDYGWFQGSLGPLAVDGLMLIAASALLSVSKERKPAPERWDRPHVFEWPTPIGPKPLKVKAEPVPENKLHVVKQVSHSDAREAALQHWLQSGQKLSTQQLADATNVSKSTAARVIRDWKEERIVRR